MAQGDMLEIVLSASPELSQLRLWPPFHNRVRFTEKSLGNVYDEKSSGDLARRLNYWGGKFPNLGEK